MSHDDDDRESTCLLNHCWIIGSVWKKSPFAIDFDSRWCFLLCCSVAKVFLSFLYFSLTLCLMWMAVRVTIVLIGSSDTCKTCVLPVCLPAHLFPNLSMELHFLAQLLITQASKDDLPEQQENLNYYGKKCKVSSPFPPCFLFYFVLNLKLNQLKDCSP